MRNATSSYGGPLDIFSIRVVVYGGYIGYALIRGCFGRIDQIRVEDVKLIPLDGFRRRVIVVVMRGVVLVPLVPGVHSVEVSRFPRFVLVVPPVKFSIAEIFLFDFAVNAMSPSSSLPICFSAYRFALSSSSRSSASCWISSGVFFSSWSLSSSSSSW